MTLSTLTKHEAKTRSDLLEVQRYDIDVDTTGLLEGEVWRSTSTIAFTCSEPGATTFVDVAMDVVRATLNGEDVDVSAAADGRDVSWLWDVDYEQLQGRSVVATGPRAQDLAVRLSYAEVEHRCVPDLAAALAGHPEPVDVIATYTPFQRLRKMGRV